ncbi:hypothetical protein ABZX85_23205 [Streptomyces sp. NPDC004539]|uniref:hypothetical protein n=1 Tax=Streptomyces sp. NPDC004539 TaxID=3154280 RepID=UPI0033A2AF72
MTSPLTEQQLAEIEARADGEAKHAEQLGEGHTLAAVDVPALVAEVRRLAALVAELDAERARWADVHAIVERAIEKGASLIDTVHLECALGPVE